MFKYKIISLIICTCILFVLSSENPVTRRLLELEEVEQIGNRQELNLDKFLAAASDEFILTAKAPTAGGFPITITDCMKGSILALNNIKVTPTELVKGKPIAMKASGVFREDRHVTNLHVEAFYNKEVIFKNDVDKTADVKKGPSAFAYDNNVPTFTPAGSWETYVWLMAGDEKVACILATFDTT
jgi:hypothetical protein